MAVLVKVDGTKEEVTIKGDFKKCQELVEGYVAQYPYCGQDGFQGILANEDGKMVGMPVNVKATIMSGYRGDFLVGDVIFYVKGEF